MLGESVPTTFAAGRLVKPEPLPLKVEALMAPLKLLVAALSRGMLLER